MPAAPPPKPPTMKPPKTGVRVRMYRQGHGDCFLLAFPAESGHSRAAVYVLIDCGYKPKSEIHGQKIDKIAADIIAATGGFVDIAVVTHEHQDHVNGFLKKKNRKRVFDDLDIGQLWLAWTEDPDDAFANQLRADYNDALLGLALAEGRFGATGRDDDTLALISDLLELELGEEEPLKPGEVAAQVREAFRTSRNNQKGLALDGHTAFALKGITNKRAIKYLREKAEQHDGVRYLSPGGSPVNLPNGQGVRIYPFGPPRDDELLTDLDPEGDEKFHLRPLAFRGPESSFLAAARELESDAAGVKAPFARKHVFREDEVMDRTRPRLEADIEKSRVAAPVDYLRATYGPRTQKTFPADTPNPDGEDWRRIDGDWLDASEALALRLNNEVNNTSLVLAFELPGTSKVLLFTGDAQRGSWLSWSDLTWDVDGCEVTARDLLGRCTFYKAGHHGSHNATLNGDKAKTYANIGWLAQGKFADEFVAMIPANTTWALGKKRPWEHPMPQIEEALKKKARGRVFRSDIDRVSRTHDVPDEDQMTATEWKAFERLATQRRLYLEYVVED